MSVMPGATSFCWPASLACSGFACLKPIVSVDLLAGLQRHLMTDACVSVSVCFTALQWYLMATSGCTGWEPNALEVFWAE